MEYDIKNSHTEKADKIEKLFEELYKDIKNEMFDSKENKSALAYLNVFKVNFTNSVDCFTKTVKSLKVKGEEDNHESNKG